MDKGDGCRGYFVGFYLMYSVVSHVNPPFRQLRKLSLLCLSMICSSVYMVGHEQFINSRVIKVDSEESWDFFVTQANTQGCPVVVHFTAAWCMPSVAMNPFFEELASSYQDILFLLVDVDDVKEVASKMEIKAMPTFLLIKEGAHEDKLVGANPEEIRKRVEAFAQSLRLLKQS
ncbi:hypothetical protein HHK36_023768 [Tetracentron sinense]|uniref:Thioredoxin domain-containing protein n=1 Tax=Tetracentron sinense TaxID=13715 RepID=A0A834YRR1_TETSI|nr:hypothetical protein HHK36_023768 [Tetracentron sinense]